MRTLRQAQGREPQLVVFLTDLYGSFPEKTPLYPRTLGVHGVPAGSLRTSRTYAGCLGGISNLVTVKRMLLPQVLRDLVNHRLKHFAPVAINRSIELQATDPAVFPSLLDCGRVNAEFEYAHGLLGSCRQCTRVFSFKFFSKLDGTVTNLSIRGRASRFLFE